MTTISPWYDGPQLIPAIPLGVYSNLYNTYFNLDSSDWTLRTKIPVNRDAMASTLMNSIAPVVLNFPFQIVDFNNLDNPLIACINLTLCVIDLDNNVPRFSVAEQPLIIMIEEGSPRRAIAIPQAIDLDEGVNGTSNYTLVDGFGIFSLEVEKDDNGKVSRVVIRNNVPLDAELQTSYNLTIIAREGNENPDNDTLLVTIIPTPICDESPYFPTSRYFASVEEESPRGTVAFSNLSASDDDIGGEERLHYFISSVFSKERANSLFERMTAHPFMLDLESGRLTIEGEVDREEYVEYEVNVRVLDSCQRSATATVVVTLEDINDHDPVIECSLCPTLGVDETTPIETVAYLSISDADAGENANVTVQLYENRGGQLVNSTKFYLDGDQLKSRSSLDYEEEQSYSFVLNATDNGTPPRYFVFNLTVSIRDFNDNPPIIAPIQPLFEVDENLVPGTEIVQLYATDRDSPETGNGEVSFSLPDSNATFPHQHLFSIETNVGRILVEGTLDREQQESLSVLVKASDNPMSNPPMSAFVIVNITLRDLNDYRPNITFPGENISISEAHTPGTIAFNVTAIDLDTPQFSNLTFGFASNSAPFSINPTTGMVTLDGPLDYETTQNYSVEIIASDGQLESSKHVLILVVDENDEAPAFTINTPSMPTVYEGLDSGYIVANITAADPDTSQTNLVFSIDSGNELQHFSIDSSTGQIQTRIPLDKESIDLYNLTIRVYDGVQYAEEDKLIFVSVLDINDHIPEFIGEPFEFNIPERMPSESSVGYVVARDRDTPNNAIIRYAIIEVFPTAATNWFNIDAVSGQITTNVVLDRESSDVPPSGVIQVRVTAQDVHNPPPNETLVNVTIDDVNDEGPFFVVPSIIIDLPENTATGYPFYTVQATDKDQPPNNQILYSLSERFGSSILQRMHIDENTGQLSLITTLDYETESRIEFVVRAHDFEFSNKFADLQIVINVTDTQECDLMFVDLPTLANVTEESPPGTVIAMFEATDTDGNPIPPPGVRYVTTTLDHTPSGLFNTTLIQGSTRANLHTLVGGRNLDRETLVNQPSGVTFQVNVTASMIDSSGACTLSRVVTITILDRNDNAPSFSNSSYHFTVSENNIEGINIGRVRATDMDLVENGTVGYSIDDNVPFAISADGMITALEVFEHEGPNQVYTFSVIARDGGNPVQSSSAIVQVNVLDVNDNPPVFSQTQNRTFQVFESSPVNTLIGDIIATDADSGSFGEVIFTARDLDVHFTLAPNGSIFLALPVDRETRSIYSFVARAEDGGQRVATANIMIIILDSNDNPPVFEPESLTSFTIREDAMSGTVITTLRVTDDDINENGRVMFSLADRTYITTFCILETGAITVCPPDPCTEDRYSSILDYERQNYYELTVLAYDVGSPRHIVNKTIEINIENVNEHEPIFDTGIINVYVDENQLDGATVAQLRAYDLDNDELSYEVLEGNQPSTYFSYVNGAIVTSEVLNYHSDRKGFDLTLKAREVSLENNGTIEVKVFVNNINDRTPSFDTIDPVRIPETTSINTIIATVHATDMDSIAYDAISYHIVHGNDEGLFRIDNLTGEIRVNKTLDYDRVAEHQLRIKASDGENTDIEHLSITLLDENDESPIFTHSQYMFTLNEHSPSGTIVGRVEAPDHDTGYFGAVKYTISHPTNDYFKVDSNNGDIISLVSIDRNEFRDQHSDSDSVTFMVRASDGGTPSRSATATVTVVIADINDHKPQFSQDRYLVPIQPNQQANTALPVSLTVTDADDGENAKFTYQLVSSDLSVSISGEEGELSLTQPLPQDYETSYSIVVRATDKQNASKYSEAEVLLLVETNNDHHPDFDQQGKYAQDVPENTPTSTSIFNMRDHVTDQDTGSNGQVSFAFDSVYPNFAIDSSTGIVTLVQSVDYESNTRMYTLDVLATDGNMRTSSAILVVSVTPINEFSPVPVPEFRTQITLSPVDYIGVDLFDFRAEDEDDGVDGMVEYNIYNDEHLFTIDRTSGMVRNLGSLTDGTSVTVIIGAYDLGTPLRSSNTTVSVTIEDPGTSVPTFSSVPTTINQPEGPGVNIPLGTFRANMAQTHHIVRHNGSEGMFSITEVGGQINLQQALDYETNTRYELVIEGRSETTTVTQLTRYSAYLLVYINVQDVNDEYPIFDPVVNPISVWENQPVGTPIGLQVHARDGDSGSNGEVQYVIVSSIAVPFSINSTTGVISISSPLDREQVSFYDLRVRAFDRSITQQKTDEVLVHIDVQDINDSPTTYDQDEYVVGVYEYPRTESGEKIIKMAATDLDLGPPLRYEIVSIQGSHMGTPVQDNLLGSFVIDFDTGMVSVGDIVLDRDEVSKYVLRIRSYYEDSGVVTEAFTNLNITVLDINDNDPELHVPATLVVYEQQPIGTRVSEENAIHATDMDSGVNGWVTYSLGTGWPQGDFTIDPLTGVVRTNNVLVYRKESHCFNATIIATDHGVPPRSASATVKVRIEDVNDHYPQFDSDYYVVQTSINTQPGEVLRTFSVADHDIRDNGALFVKIPHYYDDANDYFLVNEENATVFSLRVKRNQGLQVRNYTFRFEAYNISPSPDCTPFLLTSYAFVTVVVKPANDFCPEFHQVMYTANVLEETIPTQAVVTVSATDPEQNSITYSINHTSSSFSQNFVIDPATGDVSLHTAIDREALASDTNDLIVLASDDGFPSRTCSSVVRITVLDINDNNPVFEMERYTGSIEENTAPNTVRIMKVKAIDLDLGMAGAVVYQMTSSDNLPFRINSTTGEIFATRALDFETSHLYEFPVYAMNPLPESTRQMVTVTVNVIDVNEYSPQFVNIPPGSVVVEAGLSKGSVVAIVTASDEDGGPQGMVTYSFDNEEPKQYFSINSSTGVITFNGVSRSTSDTSSGGVVKRQVESASSDYFPVEAIVRATDEGLQSDQVTLQFQVHNSYANITPTDTNSALPLGLLIGVVSGVVLAAVAVFVVIFVCACVCQRRRNSKTGQIKDAHGPMNNGMEMGRFSSQHSSQRSGSSRSSSRFQTRIRGRHHDHSRISAGSLGSNSNRESYTAYADDEMESMAGENGVYAHSLPRKSPSPTSDLASTVATEMLQGHSQEQPPYSKAQIAAIYAANREILENTGSQNSIHMFGSEGGGEGDGDMDIDTMLFTKLNDFDDDDDDDIDDDDDDDTTLPDDNSYHEHQSMSGSGGNLTIPRPVEEHEDPFPYSPSQPKWAPQMKPMEVAIDDLHELAAYPSTDPDDHHPRLPYHMYEHHSQGTPVYEPSAQDIMRHPPMHRHHHDQRPPQQIGRMPPDYGVYGTPPQEMRHQMRHMMPHARPPRQQKRYGSAAELTHHYPHDIPPPRFTHGFSQEMPPYHHLPSHYVPQLNTHTPSSSTATPTDEGTVTPHTALTGEYMDQSYNFSSSSTSLSTQP